MDKVGGAQKHVEALAIHLKQDGHDVTVVTGSYQPSLWHLQAHKIPVISVPALQRAIHITKDFQAFWQLRAVFKHLQPDVIATHSSKAGVIGRVVGSLLRIPTILRHTAGALQKVFLKRKSCSIIGWKNQFSHSRQKLLRCLNMIGN